jgi:hypothetical protein
LGYLTYYVQKSSVLTGMGVLPTMITLPHLDRAIVKPTPAASFVQAPVTATVAHTVVVPFGRHW